MREHPKPDDFDLFALGAMDPEERREIEGHIEECAACRQEVVQAQERLAVYALAVPSRIPPLGAKRQLMRRIHESPTPAVEAPMTTTGMPRRGVSFWGKLQTAWIFAAFTAAIAIAFIIRTSFLEHSLHQYQERAQSDRALMAKADAVIGLLTAKDTQAIVLTSAPSKPQPEGRVLYQSNRGLLFYAQDLPTLPANRSYQLWLVPSEGKPISAGVFEPNTHGIASIILPTLPKGVRASAFAVTVEPRGGAPQPTGPKVLVGAA